MSVSGLVKSAPSVDRSTQSNSIMETRREGGGGRGGEEGGGEGGEESGEGDRDKLSKENQHSG